MAKHPPRVYIFAALNLLLVVAAVIIWVFVFAKRGESPGGGEGGSGAARAENGGTEAVSPAEEAAATGSELLEEGEAPLEGTMTLDLEGRGEEGSPAIVSYSLAQITRGESTADLVELAGDNLRLRGAIDANGNSEISPDDQIVRMDPSADGMGVEVNATDLLGKRILLQAGGEIITDGSFYDESDGFLTIDSETYTVTGGFLTIDSYGSGGSGSGGVDSWSGTLELSGTDEAGGKFRASGQFSGAVKVVEPAE